MDEQGNDDVFDMPSADDLNALPETLVVICRRVLSGVPVLRVTHEADGSWQLLCGGTHSELDVDDSADGPAFICYSHLADRDLTLADVASIPRSRAAVRTDLSGGWQVVPLDGEEV